MKPDKTSRRHHEGFKQKLIDKAGNTRKFAHLKTIAKSPFFVEVETAMNNTIMGRRGVVVDHDILMNAITEAYLKYKDKSAYLPLRVKTASLNNALKKADALRLALEKIGEDYLEITPIKRIENRIRTRKEIIKREHDFNLSRAIKKNEGLTAEQAVFCRWLCVYLRVKYPHKLFSRLIAAIARCLFDDENIDDYRIKNNLTGNLYGIDQRAKKLFDEERDRSLFVSTI
ncbi:MAG: hypothetical protein PHH11_08955 [Methylomonas sp.]|nr:hypothetical protein [Methylomonas sp.]